MDKPITRIRHWIWLPLMLFALLASVLLAFAMGGNLLTAGVYALFTVAMTVIIVIGAVKAQYGGEDIEQFMQSPGNLSAEERRARARQNLNEMRDELLKTQQRKNLVDFWSKAVIVVVYIYGYSWVMFQTLGLYPSESLFVPLPVLALIWFLFLRFLPRTLVILLLVACTGISAVVGALGPRVLLQMLPYFMTMPMFMFMNFFIMFGPLMFFNIRQIQIVKPGEGDWGVTFDDVRGQPEALKQILAALATFLYEGSEKPLFREKGILMEGPPGTGKTLTAKAIATHLNSPVILTTGSAFTSTFIGVGIFVMLYLKMRAEGLANQFGRCVLFIDEAEQLLQRRQGMQDQQSSSAANSPFALMEHDEFGAVGDLVFDSAESRAMAWQKKFPAKYPDNHPVIMGAGMGMGGAQMALPVYLHWMDGVPTPPFSTRFWRSNVNWLLDILGIPPFLRVGKVKLTFRVPRATPKQTLVLHLAATNLASLIDPAMLRPGRFGLTTHFVAPGEAEREEIAQLYMVKAIEAEALDRKLLAKQRIMEFARAAVGFSPAQIMQAVYSAQSIRKAHIARMKLISRQREDAIEAGMEPEDILDELDLRYWKRYSNQLRTKNWDRPVADWDSLLESLRVIRYGMSKPNRTTSAHRETTAVHEFAGHLMTLRAFAADFIKPTMLSIMPRGMALGMVAHVPIEEHDPQPQRRWEGMLRVMVGSVVAERLFFGESAPGVVSDLEMASRTAAYMVNNWGMVPRACKDAEERERYIKIGSTLLSNRADPPMMGMSPSGPGMGGKRDDICLLLGQAFVDDYRLIVKNRDLVQPVVDTLLETDEIMGAELEKLWDELGGSVRPLTRADLELWPDELIEPQSPFYRMEEVENA